MSKYTSAEGRADSSRAWKAKFNYQHLKELGVKSIEILKMDFGKDRRKLLLELLSTGYRIRLNHQKGGGWSSKDKDIKYLLKKKKVCRHKQYSRSAITDHLSHTYIGNN